MFSVEDIREIHQLFPPPESTEAKLPSLVLTSSNQGFITAKSLKAEFENRMSQEPSRVPVLTLSEDLDVDRSTILQLARATSGSALVNNDSSHIVPKAERYLIERSIRAKLEHEFLAKQVFATENDIDLPSLQVLLAGVSDLVSHDDLVCTPGLDQDLSKQITGMIEGTIENTTHTYTNLADLKELPGSPPLWLALWHYKNIIKSQGLESEVFLREFPDRIECQSRKLKARNVKGRAIHLLSGKESYYDLHIALKESPNIYESIDDVKSAFAEEPGLELVDSYALSERWFQQFVDKSLQHLHYHGIINVETQLQKCFPDTVLKHAINRTEKAILLAAAQKPDLKLNVRHFGSSILTDIRYEEELDALVVLARNQAGVQWEQKKADHNLELKFCLPSDVNDDPKTATLQEILLRERSVEKAVDEAFWAAILEHEAQNEKEFANFWIERVTCRLQVYKAGLEVVEDSKLKAQLAELLATYLQKDLMPDAVSKARSQGLLLSRRTLKNIQKLETKVQGGKAEVDTLLAHIDKFNKKQDMSDPPQSVIEESKSTMVKDMLRRMQKQQKPSDGPVLFLTLVTVLFAKHYSGVVYATGKFAPKLLKQLKSKLSHEEYEQVEKWKEAAKLGTLDGNDRDEMKKMAETWG